MDKQIIKHYEAWKNYALEEAELTEELARIGENEADIIDRFYRELDFGTGGLRGVIGVGTNRMNIYTVGKATQGYCNYIKRQAENPSVAIAYDSRIKSDVFAKRAAEVFAANGIKVYIYPELMPTPALSFAIRYLGCQGGIVITASHNPAKYNGYKVYGSDGCQITTVAAEEILSEIKGIDIFSGVSRISLETALAEGKAAYIQAEVVSAYIRAVSEQSLCPEGIDKKVSIVYTPLNGAGLNCVTRVLNENGFTDIHIVKEQEKPDGNFPTCPYPNPEIKEALELGLRDARCSNSDLLLATDPDCDRVGIAVKSDNKEYVLLSGNEVGMLLLDYICKRRTALGTMPENPILIKTIVTIDMAARIAQNYGVKTLDVLTGFKYIGEQIGILEEKGEEIRYILGFEESYGYLSGTYVRDKDAVNAALMICEMFAYYKSQGLSLLDVLKQLYEKYGYCLNTLHNYVFEGVSGQSKMQNIMQKLREQYPVQIAGKQVLEVKDYSKGVDGLPKSDVLKFLLDGYNSIVVRPSGTEPKIKLYISVNAENKQKAKQLEEIIETDMRTLKLI